MREVTVRKDEFITRVSANRDNHRAVFERALDGYRRRIIAELERRVDDVRRGVSIDQRIGLPEPEDHTDDYDRVLTMAQMSVDDTITLSSSDFAMYVMDQWDWRQSFATTHGPVRQRLTAPRARATWRDVVGLMGGSLGRPHHPSGDTTNRRSRTWHG